MATGKRHHDRLERAERDIHRRPMARPTKTSTDAISNARSAVEAAEMSTVRSGPSSFQSGVASSSNMMGMPSRTG